MAASSFNQDHSISASLDVGVKLGTGKDSPTLGGSIGGGFTYALGKTGSASIEIKKDEGFSLSRTGPDKDGIDHDQDQLVLWLNPTVDLLATDTQAAWGIHSGGTKITQNVLVGELRGTLKMDSGVEDTLRRFGITPADYPTILARDPFYTGNPNQPFVEAPLSDHQRFLRTGYSLPYRTYTQGGGSTGALSISNENTSVDGQSTTKSYKVNLSNSVSLSFSPLIKAALKTEDNWEWTNTATSDKSRGATQSSEVTIAFPSNGYNGLINGANVLIFYDQLYKTFAFVITNDPKVLQGNLRMADGRPAVGQKVTAAAGGTILTTYADPQGDYAFVDELKGPVEIRSGDAVKSVAQAGPGQRVDLLVDQPNAPDGPVGRPTNHDLPPIRK